MRPVSRSQKLWTDLRIVLLGWLSQAVCIKWSSTQLRFQFHKHAINAHGSLAGLSETKYEMFVGELFEIRMTLAEPVLRHIGHICLRAVLWMTDLQYFPADHHGLPRKLTLL